jgi:hypothetical protein
MVLGKPNQLYFTVFILETNMLIFKLMILQQILILWLFHQNHLFVRFSCPLQPLSGEPPSGGKFPNLCQQALCFGCQGLTLLLVHSNITTNIKMARKHFEPLLNQA